MNKRKSAPEDALTINDSITRTAEENIISILLLDSEKIDEVLSIVSEEDFYYVPTRTIFKAIKDFHESNEGVDVLSVWDKLDKEGKLDLIGNELTLNHYADHGRDAEGLIDVIQDAKILKENANKRRIQELGKMILNSDRKPKELLSEIDNALSNLFPEVDHDIHFGLIYRKEELLEALKNPPVFKQSTIFEGFKFMAGDVLLLKGKTGHGKTTIAMNVTDDLLMGCGTSEPLSVLYFTYEIKDFEIIRGLAKIIGMTPEKLIDSRGKYLDVFYGIDRLVDIEARVRVATREMGKPLDLVVIDYDTYLKPVGRFENEERRVNAISKALKRVAVKYDTTVMLLSQVNGNGTAKWGTVKEEDASVVINLEMDEDQEEAMLKGQPEWSVTARVVKSRNGAFGKQTLTFNRETRALKSQKRIEL